MSLTVNTVFRAYGAYRADKPLGRDSRATEKKTSAEITSKAKEFGTLLHAVSEAPDLRPDKVADIKTRVERGHYDVSSNAIANKILGEPYMEGATFKTEG